MKKVLIITIVMMAMSIHVWKVSAAQIVGLPNSGNCEVRYVSNYAGSCTIQKCQKCTRSDHDDVCTSPIITVLESGGVTNFNNRCPEGYFNVYYKMSGSPTGAFNVPGPGFGPYTVGEPWVRYRDGALEYLRKECPTYTEADILPIYYPIYEEYRGGNDDPDSNDHDEKCWLTVAVCGRCSIDPVKRCREVGLEHHPSCAEGWNPELVPVKLDDGSGKSLKCYKCIKEDDPDGVCKNNQCGPQHIYKPVWIPAETREVEIEGYKQVEIVKQGYWQDQCEYQSCLRSCPNCLDQERSIYGLYHKKCSESCSCVGYTNVQCLAADSKIVNGKPTANNQCPGATPCGHHQAPCPPPVSCPAGSDGSILSMGQRNDFDATCGVDSHPRDARFGKVHCLNGAPNPYQPGYYRGQTLITPYRSYNANYDYGTCGIGDKWCWRPLTCADIAAIEGNGYSDAYDPHNYPTDEWYFDPDDNKNGDGTKGGARCGKYHKSSSPFWKAIGANVYARDQLINNSKNTTAYTIGGRYGGNWNYAMVCPDTSSMTLNANSAGLPLSSSSRANDVLNGIVYKTQRDNTQTSGYPVFTGIGEGNKLRQDFSYFASLLDYDSLSRCTDGKDVVIRDGNVGVSSTSDIPHYACRVDGSIRVNELKALGVLSLDNITVFVSDELEFDSGLFVPRGKFVAFIVRNKTIVNADVGSSYIKDRSIDFSYCSEDRAANCILSYADETLTSIGTHPNLLNGIIEAVLITGQLQIDADESSVRPEVKELNVQATCDKTFVFSGILSIWGDPSTASTGGSSSDLKLTRSYRGCNTDNYCNLNANNPAHIFVYRPDFLTNAPNWMKNTIKLRLETL